MLRSKACQRVKCVEKESELGCKEYRATLKQSVPKEQVFLEAKCGSARYVFRNKSLDSAFLLVVLGIYQLKPKYKNSSPVIVTHRKSKIYTNAV